MMKCFFIGSSVYILYLMKRPFRPTHDPNLDTFKIEYLLIGSFVASLVFNYEFSLSEVNLPIHSSALKSIPFIFKFLVKLRRC